MYASLEMIQIFQKPHLILNDDLIFSACPTVADVIISLDSSSSVGPGFNDLMDFEKGLVESLPFDTDSGIRFGVQSYADEAKAEIHLNQFTNRKDLINSISFKEMTGSTNTAVALRHLREVMFTEEHGDRPDARNIVILLTDGRSNDRGATWDEAVLLRNDDVTIITVGFEIQGDYDLREMKGITSNPDELNFFNVNSSLNVRQVAEDIMYAVCTSECWIKHEL